MECSVRQREAGAWHVVVYCLGPFSCRTPRLVEVESALLQHRPHLPPQCRVRCQRLCELHAKSTPFPIVACGRLSHCFLRRCDAAFGDFQGHFAVLFKGLECLVGACLDDGLSLLTGVHALCTLVLELLLHVR